MLECIFVCVCVCAYVHVRVRACVRVRVRVRARVLVCDREREIERKGEDSVKRESMIVARHHNEADTHKRVIIGY
jgi:hypothetical protein